MIEDLQSNPVSSAPADNPAIARCCQAFDRARRSNIARTKGGVGADLDGKDAYRKAMPPLSGLGNIRDFIACVAHGMLIRAIDESQGARLLYAAHIAYSTADKPPAKQKTAA